MERWTATPALVMQLSLFADQLYLQPYDDYVRLCRHLRILFTHNSGSRPCRAEIERTHMGRILAGGVLTQQDFFTEEEGDFDDGDDDEMDL